MPGTTFRRLDRDAVVRELRAWARRDLATRPEVRSATLIGSLARGNWSARSDADVVLVVADGTPLERLGRGTPYLPADAVGAPVELFVFTESEAAGWRPRYAADVAAGIALLPR